MIVSAAAAISRSIRLPRFYVLLSGLIVIAGLTLSLADVAFLSPWLRLIVGLLVFILPGGYLFALIPAREDWDLIDFIVYGFAFSVALITALGLITRTLALHIDMVEFIWHTLAIVGFAAVLYRQRRAPAINFQLRPPVIAMLAAVLILAALFAYTSLFSANIIKDNFRHHAAVNGFLRDEPLGWAEPYYESGNPIADRMYLTYWVLAQALAVEIGGAPILLARYLISPFVVLVSTAGIYVFARNLGHSRQSSLIYVGLGLFALSLVAKSDPQAGVRLLERSQLDKVVAAFALAPVAISSAYLCSHSRHWRPYFGFALAMLAAGSVHAILGGFAVGIVGIWCMIQFVTGVGERRNALRIGLLALILFAPTIFIRLGTAEKTIYNFESVNEDVFRKMVIFDSVNPLNNGERFYAISPVSAGDLTYLLAPLVFLSVAARRFDARSKLMLAYMIAISIGLLPFTAWIYARLVSFNHVMRILWLMPYGYMIGFVLETGWKLLNQRKPSIARNIGGKAKDWLLVGLILLTLPVTLQTFHSEGIDFSQDIALAPSSDAELLEIGAYIDAQHEQRVWIAASYKYREPVIAMGWKVISLSRYAPERMSYYSNLPIENTRAQINDNHLLYKDIPLEEKLAIIDRYGIDYLLFNKKYAWMIDKLYQSDKQRFELVYSGDTLRLVRVH